MKRAWIAVLFAAVAQSAMAGLSYRIDSTTTGTQERKLSGLVEVEGSKFRMNVDKGDGMVFPDSSYVISTNGGHTLSVVDPAAKTYFEMPLDQLAGGVGAMMQQMGDKVKFTTSDPKVDVKDLGAGETIEGYATRKKSVDTSYDMNVEVMGQKMTISMSMATQSWVTDQLSMNFASFLQTGELRTGMPDIDKIIAAQAKGVTGFPLKQVANVHIQQNGMDMNMTTTTNVSSIQKKTIADSEFVVPAGFTKVDSPIEKMMKMMGGTRR